MSKANISPKLERKDNEDVSPTSKTCLKTDDNSTSFVKSGNSSKNTDHQSVPREDKMSSVGRDVSEALKPSSTLEASSNHNVDEKDGNIITFIQVSVFSFKFQIEKYH